MNVFVYDADLCCEDCGRAIAAELDEKGTEDDGTSDTYPQGPYPDGGGEADSPQHCGSGAGCLNAIECERGTQKWKVGEFLDNPLTEDGYAYVAEAVYKHVKKGEGTPEVLRLWLKSYHLEWDIIVPTWI